MSYTALYRKLRPKTFDNVVGQKFITKILKNQISNSKVSHAYLFCGTRGTGKTSIAKIFATAINCKTPTTENEPCNECEVCISIKNNRNLNVIEIDAASNNGVENIRDIREDVKYPPTLGKYKIYIIDEVHMLSNGAFNALLKTLEEPPSYVIFILATTDPQKIPATILSRCQRFDFKRIPSQEMFESLKKYSSQENILIEDEALKYIVNISDGAMRDALSLLDMSTSFYSETIISYNNILDLVGSVDTKTLADISNALSNFDSETCIEIISNVVSLGRDVTQFTNELLIYFRNMLVSLNIQKSSMALDYSPETIEKFKKSGQTIGSEKLFLYINTFSNLQNDMKYANNKQLLLEVTCIKLCNIQTFSDVNSLLLRIEKLESIISSGNIEISHNIVKPNVIEKSTNSLHQQKNTVEVKNDETYSSIDDIKNRWIEFVLQFSPAVKTILKKTEINFKDENNTIFLLTENPSKADILNNVDYLSVIKQTFEDILKKEVSIKIMCKSSFGENDIDLKKQDEIEFKSFTDKINMDIIIEEE